MKRSIKILKRLGIGILGLVLLLVLGTIIFTHTAPQIGQEPEGEDLIRMQSSSHYADGEFVNELPALPASFQKALSKLPEMLFGDVASPDNALPVKFGENRKPAVDSLCFVTWYGHSAFLIELEGKRILIDPMLSERPSPLPFGTGRYPYQKPIPLDELTAIDAIIISHDHYDHLDYPTIQLLKDRVGHFYTPIGVGSHLKHWGIDPEKITELDWWETGTLGSMEIAACPSRHFSGRALTDRNATLWASWVIRGKDYNLYFSGDGGYGPHFKAIGNKYGPFDLAMMECGQYNEAWSDIHMMPEESVQAGLDVRGNLLMPIHWGAFQLSLHDWLDPIQRFKAEAAKLNASYIHPYIGERFQLNADLPQEEWWTVSEK